LTKGIKSYLPVQGSYNLIVFGLKYLLEDLQRHLVIINYKNMFHGTHLNRDIPVPPGDSIIDIRDFAVFRNKNFRERLPLRDKGFTRS
jgi:hypothetical protein